MKVFILNSILKLRWECNGEATLHSLPRLPQMEARERRRLGTAEGLREHGLLRNSGFKNCKPSSNAGACSGIAKTN